MASVALIFRGTKKQLMHTFNQIKKTPAAKMRLIDFAPMCEYNCGCCDDASKCSYICEPIIASNMTIGMNGDELRQFINFKMDEYLECQELEEYH